MFSPGVEFSASWTGVDVLWSLEVSAARFAVFASAERFLGKGLCAVLDVSELSFALACM